MPNWPKPVPCVYEDQEPINKVPNLEVQGTFNGYFRLAWRPVHSASTTKLGMMTSTQQRTWRKTASPIISVVQIFANREIELHTHELSSGPQGKEYRLRNILTAKRLLDCAMVHIADLSESEREAMDSINQFRSGMHNTSCLRRTWKLRLEVNPKIPYLLAIRLLGHVGYQLRKRSKNWAQLQIRDDYPRPETRSAK